jgi:DNA-binding MarR family transcriptional regulator
MIDGDEIKFGEAEPTPNYYAVIPAEVRYDTRLSPRAILVFGELSALANKYGYAWPSNGYFAELYHVRKQAVSGWLHELEQAGYIRIVLGRANRRRIHLLWKTGIPITEKRNSYDGKPDALLNSKSNNTNEKKQSRVPARVFEDDDLQAEWEVFVTNRKQMGKSLTTISRERILTKLRKWDTRTALAALNASNEHGWTSVYEPKQPPKAKLPYKTREDRINALNVKKQQLMREDAPYWKIHEVNMQLSKL